MGEMDLNGFTARRYVLVTAAYNEETLIEGLITSVVSQSLLPRRWIIVSDGSTDRTDAIVKSYMGRYPFLQLFRVTEDHPRNFAAQANAINVGFSQLRDCDYDYIGNLDADISFEPMYFQQLITQFENDPRLGIGGGAIWEDCHGEFMPRKGNRTESVANAVQLFRRECFEAIGQRYVPLQFGGHDWHAEVTVRMKGWGVQTFPELRVFHHRPTGAGSGMNRYSFRQGFMDFTLGVHPFFEIGKLLRRSSGNPTAAIFRIAGYFLACCRNEGRVVSPEFVEFLREEQRKRMLGWFSSAWNATVKKYPVGRLSSRKDGSPSGLGKHDR